MSALKEWLAWHSIYSHIAAPIWLRAPEKARWRIVSWLNKSNRFCWSDLVDDALAHRESDACDIHVPRLVGNRAPDCASTCYWMHPDHAGEHDCSCYCGKFQFKAPDGSMQRREVSS